jgi:eukaryotic-like serine/threonine-protein kinase
MYAGTRAWDRGYVYRQMGHRDLSDRVRQALGDRYTVITAVGRGGAATIYGARDKDGTPVAIKVLHPELSASVASDRFLREIRYAGELHHPRIAALLDSGESDYLLWYVMPYVPGDTLRQALNRARRLPTDRAVQVACDVLEALGYAHARGFAHRDIKPENIVLGPDGAVVLDFGIARAIASSGEDRVTQSGFVVGTEVYMSPEQAGGATEIDGRTDIYSLGIVLFEALAGRPPFSSPSAVAVLEMHQRQSAPALESLRPETPEGVAQVVARALKKAPADRWPTAGEMRAALLPFAARA